MFVILIVALVAAGVLLVIRGFVQGHRPSIVGGAALTVGAPVLFAAMSLWAEYLWFDQLGFGRRFATQAVAMSVSTLVGAGSVAGLVALLTRPVRTTMGRVRTVGLAVGATLGGLAGLSSWSVALRWLRGVRTGVRDPILGLDTGFHLFSVPFYDAVFVAAALGVAVAVGVLIVGARRRGAHGGGEQPDEAREDAAARALFAVAGAAALVLAASRALAIVHLLTAHHGIVHGPGWTDVHVGIPANVVTGVVLVVAAVVLLTPPVRRAVAAGITGSVGPGVRAPAATVIATALASGLVWAVGLGVLPISLQALKVTPNELALERPYLEHAIAFTRAGFGLDRVEERPFEVKGRLTRELVEEKRHVLDEVRLWDPRALDQVLEQFQELRLYYEISAVDIDRYGMDGRYRQVLVAPREMETANLPLESRTFVNRHFKYTHGYGLAMAPVSDFTPDGLPRLVVRDLPPVAEHESLEVTRPEIYFGEHTDDFVVVNSETPEFDYPSTDGNVYTRYEGTGGVPLGGMWRKFLYAWHVGGTSLFFSNYPKDDSRILFRRSVRDRVAAVAPFLEIDQDPYLVVVDGRLVWILDAYTTSTRYPYSEPLPSSVTAASRLGEPLRGGEDPPGVPRRVVPAPSPFAARPPELTGVNYLRNSVKAVVDAYDGSVRLYVFDEADPVAQVWSRIFPELFLPADDMPAGLRAHVRYPETLLAAQGEVYAKYHMTDPMVFYNQEDLWIHATEKHYGTIRVVEPYYVMWQPPGSDRAEFIVMQPFTPKQRQVLSGWVAGMCDGDNYGRLLAYRFPKDQWVLGPQQVDTKIDQDPILSAQLTLWDQLGKRVIRGNVLAIPIEDTLLYVEPIYLQAEAAAYPELRMVVAMEGENMSYAPTFEQALAGLVDRGAAPSEAILAAGLGVPLEVLQRAGAAFDEYLRLTGQQRFEEAAVQLRRLGEELAPGARAAEEPALQ